MASTQFMERPVDPTVDHEMSEEQPPTPHQQQQVMVEEEACQFQDAEDATDADIGPVASAAITACSAESDDDEGEDNESNEKENAIGGSVARGNLVGGEVRSFLPMRVPGATSAAQKKAVVPEVKSLKIAEAKRLVRPHVSCVCICSLNTYMNRLRRSLSKKKQRRKRHSQVNCRSSDSEKLRSVKRRRKRAETNAQTCSCKLRSSNLVHSAPLQLLSLKSRIKICKRNSSEQRFDLNIDRIDILTSIVGL